MRIQARAARRVGELLAKIKPGKAGRPNGKRIGSGPATKLLTRGEAARDAGLSKDQQVRAMRVAKIPQKEFDLMVDSDDPPSVSDLADAADAIGFDLLLDWITAGPPRPPESSDELLAWSRKRGLR